MSTDKAAATEEVDRYLKGSGVDSEREQMIGQHIGYRYDVNLVPDMGRITPFLKKYIDHLAVLINGPPQIMLLTLDLHEYFINEESITISLMFAP